MPNQHQVHGHLCLECHGLQNLRGRLGSAARRGGLRTRNADALSFRASAARSNSLESGHAGVREKNTPFRRACALQFSGRNCSPAPDLVLPKLVFPLVLLCGGVFLLRLRHPAGTASLKDEPHCYSSAACPLNLGRAPLRPPSGVGESAGSGPLPDSERPLVGTRGRPRPRSSWVLRAAGAVAVARAAAEARG